MELLKYVLTRPGVEVNRGDADGDTALHVKRTATLSLSLSSKPHLFLRMAAMYRASGSDDAPCESARLLFARQVTENVDAARILIEGAGANAGQVNSEGQTPVRVVAREQRERERERAASVRLE